MCSFHLLAGQIYDRDNIEDLIGRRDEDDDDAEPSANAGVTDTTAASTGECTNAQHCVVHLQLA